MTVIFVSIALKRRSRREGVYDVVVGDKCIGRCTLAVQFKYSSRTVCVDISDTTSVVRRIYYSSQAI